MSKELLTQEEKAPDILAGQALRSAIEEQIKARRENSNSNGLPGRLHERITDILDHVAATFEAEMRALGIEAHIAHMKWRPITDVGELDASGLFERLANLTLEVVPKELSAA